MDDSYGVAAGEHISGETMHKYLLSYARKWDLLRRIKFRTAVSIIERDEARGGWNVTLTPTDTTVAGDKPAESTLWTKKLIIATGITNEPHQPGIPGQGDFEGPIIHSSALGREQGRLTKDPSIKTVAVLGGGKSAYDAVYLAACAGKQVEWIIRKSGKGPAWVFPSHAQLGPFKAWREVL
jgi:cation diffusion facilitator CzcD-associated flavoprotein CzcO